MFRGNGGDRRRSWQIVNRITWGSIILIVLMCIMVIPTRQRYDLPEKKPYNEFVEMVTKCEVEEVNITLWEDIFEFKTKEGINYRTDNPRSTDFKKYLLENNVKVNEIEPSKTSERVYDILGSGLYLLCFFGIIMYVMNRTGAASLTKKTEAIMVLPKTKFCDIAGNEEAKEEMKFLVEFLKNPRKYDEMGAKLPKGVILFGSPGTGKTLMARAIAGEAGVPFFNVNGSDFVELYVGMGAKRVRNLFEQAKANAPCIVFIDEIDAVGRRRGKDNNSEKDQTINALLSQLDGFDDNEGIVVMAATNRIEDLDPALIRAGRFDRHIAIELPDYKDRLKILEIYAKNKKLDKDINLERLAKMTVGFSGASLETLLNESTIFAVNRGSNLVQMQDIDEVYYKIIMKGNKKKNRDENTDLELIAYHEAGHALVAKLLTDNDVAKVTIVPSTNGAGGVTFNIPKKMGLFTKKELLDNIKVCYAGRAGEYLLKGDDSKITTGASQDIIQATEHIMKYFNDYGMSEKYGMLRVGDIKQDIFLDEAVELSKKLYEETLMLLDVHKETLASIAKELLEKETINEEDLDRIINHTMLKNTDDTEIFEIETE